MKLSDLKQQLLSLLTANEHVGVFVSGGLDSGLLLYLCCLIKKEYNLPTNIHIFMVPDPNPKNEDSEVVYAKQVIDWVAKTFNISLKITMVGNPYEHHSKKIWSGILIARNICKCLLLGDMTNPEPLANDPHAPIFYSNTVPEVVRPFLNITKKEVVALIIELNLIGLMIAANSCQTYVPIRCGICWSCRERAWAFEQNNYEDPGTS